MAEGQDIDGPLIGFDGFSYVSTTLANNPPGKALKDIQDKAGLQHPLCKHALGLADQLGLTRLDAHRGILQAAKRTLLSKVQHMNAQGDRVKLERLLNASFKYLGISELREVPMAVMEKLEEVSGCVCA